MFPAKGWDGEEGRSNSAKLWDAHSLRDNEKVSREWGEKTVMEARELNRLYKTKEKGASRRRRG